jgi:hypothetical protein
MAPMRKTLMISVIVALVTWEDRIRAVVRMTPSLRLLKCTMNRSLVCEELEFEREREGSEINNSQSGVGFIDEQPRTV